MENKNKIEKKIKKVWSLLLLTLILVVKIY